MKKIIAIIAAALCFATVASAQPKAVGIRGLLGVEISYQHDLSSTNFVEADLGLWGHSMLVTGIYDFKIATFGPGINFYAGPGAALGFYSYEDVTGAVLGIRAQAGLEYQFDSVPIQVSLDWRPGYNFVNASGFDFNGIALGVRYAF